MKYFLMSLMIFAIIGCDKEDDIIDPKPIENIQYEYVFNSNSDLWLAEFTDVNPKLDTMYHFNYGIENLPNPLTGKGMKLQSNNHSDDLFMYIKKKITNLKPNSNYKVSLDINLATEPPQNSVGVGGSPGASVVLKAGASEIEPKRLLETQEYVTLNIGKGQQSTEGSDLKIIGDISNGKEKYEYTIINRKNNTDYVAKTDANGNLWICIGTDSGYEGITTIYFTKIKLSLNLKP